MIPPPPISDPNSGVRPEPRDADTEPAAASPDTEDTAKQTGLRLRPLYIVAGTISLALGIIGIFVPLLPTTPFLLLTAAAYSRGSTRLYQWLMNHKHLGPYIRNFREHKAIPLRAKIISISLLWTTIGFSIFFAGMPLPIQILLGAIAIGVTWHILSFKTLS